MSLIPTGDEKRFVEMRDVIELYVQNKRPATIAKELGIRKVDVEAHLEEWRKSAVGSQLMKDRVEELIASMDEHYSLIINKLYEVVAEVDETYADADKGKAAMLAQKTNALKSIMDAESRRVDILQKSGLLEAAEQGDELAYMQEQMDMMKTILEEELGPECKKRVQRRIRDEMQQQVVVVSNA